MSCAQQVHPENDEPRTPAFDVRTVTSSVPEVADVFNVIKTTQNVYSENEKDAEMRGELQEPAQAGMAFSATIVRRLEECSEIIDDLEREQEILLDALLRITNSPHFQPDKQPETMRILEGSLFPSYTI